MLDRSLFYSIAPPPTIRKGLRIHLEQSISKIVNRKDSNEILLFKITNAYKYFITELGLEETVILEGAPKKEIEEIKETVLEHELQSPQVSTILLIDLIAKSSVLGGCSILKLLRKTRKSIISRFLLYRNIYNLEVLHRRGRLFNYCGILRNIWNFHIRYRNALWTIINTDSQTEKYLVYSEEYKDKTIRPIEDLYLRIEELSEKILKNLAEKIIPNEEDCRDIKFLRTNFSTLSYHAYCIHMHTQNDLLLLFYELFNRESNIESTALLGRIFDAITIHIEGFNRKIEKLESVRYTSEHARVRIEELKETICAFYNPNSSVLVHIAVPLVHRVSCYIIICSKIRILMTTLYSIKLPFVFFCVNEWPVEVSFTLFLSAWIAVVFFAGYVLKLNRVTDCRMKVLNRIPVQEFIDGLCVGGFLFSILIWKIFEKSIFSGILYLIIGYSLVSISVGAAIFDPRIRILPLFLFKTNKEKWFLLSYIAIASLFFLSHSYANSQGVI